MNPASEDEVEVEMVAIPRSALRNWRHRLRACEELTSVPSIWQAAKDVRQEIQHQILTAKNLEKS